MRCGNLAYGRCSPAGGDHLRRSPSKTWEDRLPPSRNPDAGARSDEPDAAYLDLIRSSRVGERLRAELLKRAEPDDPAYRPKSLTPDRFAVLRALLDRVIPPAGAVAIDLAARLDARMAADGGKGWRYEALPEDREAYARGLDTLDAIAAGLHARPFSALSEEERDAVLDALAEGRDFGLQHGDDGLAPSQMKRWFEEVRSDAARLYAAHPAVMARIGYGGIANGGRGGEAFTGFAAVGIGEREAWEPVGAIEAAR